MLQVHRREDVLLLSCLGNIINGEESEALHAALIHLLGTRDSERVVVDLRGVRKVDCAGLGVLADGARRALKAGKSLQLANIPRGVFHLLQLTRLSTIFAADEMLSNVSAA